MSQFTIIGTPLYQWESGRKLRITPLLGMTVDSVHFSNYGDSTALVVKPKEENGHYIADIPNILLQDDQNIVVYSVNVSEDKVETIRECVFPVRKRAKPSSYVYTETEILNYTTLEKRVKALEKGGGGSGTVTEEQIAAAVEAYMAEHPVQGDSVLTVETITIGEDSGGDDPGTEEIVAVTGLTLDLSTYSATVGDSFYINPVVAPSNATNKAVTWKSSAASIATVDGNGYVECIAEGDATITCTTADGGFSTTCAVSVAAAESGGDEPGGDNGGESTGQKIQFSTLERTNGGIKADGTAHTLGGTYYVTIPYSEGMYIRTLYGSWAVSTYPAILVLTDGVYSTPAYNNKVVEDDGSTTETIGGSLPNHVDATLTGYATGSSVIVNMLIGSANAAAMDSCDWLYYIPGG